LPTKSEQVAVYYHGYQRLAFGEVALSHGMTPKDHVLLRRNGRVKETSGNLVLRNAMIQFVDREGGLQVAPLRNMNYFGGFIFAQPLNRRRKQPEMSAQTMNDIVALSERSITLDRNEYLKVKGSTDTNIYYVEQGSLRLFVLDDCIEQIIRFGYKGNLVVAIDSYLTGRPSELYIQAIKKTVVRVITRKQMEDYLSTEVNRMRWTEILEDLVMQQYEREIDILTNSPRERYQRVLKRSPQLFQEIPERYIANYIRMSPETLSRIKKS